MRMDISFVTVNFSASSTHESPKVNKLEVDDNIVLDVILVIDRLKLKVSCAANQSGATFIEQQVLGCRNDANNMPRLA